MTARSIPFLVAAALLAYAPETGAQVRIVGAITGTVVDTAGLAVPGARVQLKDELTGIQKETDSNNDGAFVFPDLNFGSYEISVTLQGFQTARVTQVVVESSRTTDLRVTMHPGGLDEVVEVTGATPVLETTSNVISGTLTNTQLREMPLGGDGRNVFQLARLVPGYALIYYDEGTLMFSATAGDYPGQSQSFDLQPGFPGFTPGGLTLQSQLPPFVVFPRQYQDVFNQADFTFGNTSFATMKGICGLRTCSPGTLACSAS